MASPRLELVVEDEVFELPCRMHAKKKIQPCPIAIVQHMLIEHEVIFDLHCVRPDSGVHSVLV